MKINHEGVDGIVAGVTFLTSQAVSGNGGEPRSTIKRYWMPLQSFMIYFSDLGSSVIASVTVKRCLESEANTKIKCKKQSGIMSAVLVFVVNALSTCVCIWLHR